MTLNDALEHADRWWQDENLADRTRSNYARNLRRLDRELDLLGAGVAARLKRWRDRQQQRWRDRKISASHISSDRSALLSFYDGLIAQGRFKENPARGLAGVPAEKGRPRPIPVEDQVKLLELPDLETAAGLRDRAVLECLRNGMRQGEVIGLRLNGVSYDGRGALFLEFRAKGRNRKKRVRDLPLEPSSAFIVVRYLLQHFAPRDWKRWVKAAAGDTHAQYMVGLQKLLRRVRGRTDPVFTTDTGRPLYQMWINRMFNRYRDAAGADEKWTAHTMRHRFCTSLLENGVDMRVSMRLTGHEGIESLMRYTDVARTGAIAAVGAIGASPGVEVFLGRKP